MAYVDVAELQRVLQKPSPTADEQTAMQRDLDTAAREIDWDMAFDPVDNPAAAGTPSTGCSPTSIWTGPSNYGRPQRPFGAQQARTWSRAATTTG
jgi:hypothetical protein